MSQLLCGTLGIFLLILSSCVTSQVRQSPAVSFHQAAGLLAKLKNQNEVSKALGKPSMTTVRDGKEWWDYNDPSTGNQRLSLKFNNSKVLESVLWVPGNDPENKLEEVLAHYPNVKFEPIRVRELSHSINTETVYSDKKGISLLHSDHSKRVEAITWYRDEGDARIPAGDRQPKN